jgi:hypothetical protein
MLSHLSSEPLEKHMDFLRLLFLVQQIREKGC